MSKEIRKSIDEAFGFEAVGINSALVSAQNRQRLYWVGKREPDGTYSKVPVTQPEDRGILLRDILETGTCWREKAYTLDANYYKATEGTTPFTGRQSSNRMMAAEVININPSGHGMNGAVIHTNGKSRTLTTNKGEGQKIIEPVCLRYERSEQAKQLRKAYEAGEIKHGYHEFHELQPREDGKTNTLSTVLKDNQIIEPVGVGYRNRREDDDKLHRRFETHCEPKANALTTVQTDSMVAEPIRIGTIESTAKNADFDSQQYRVYSPGGKSVTLCGNGGGVGAKTGLYAVPTDKGFVVSNELAPKGKTYPIYEVRNGLITIKDKQYPIKLPDGFYIIRKLTVTECMRLQTVPEWYVFPVSNSQAYKMLGNGWTVAVIAHLINATLAVRGEKQS